MRQARDTETRSNACTTSSFQFPLKVGSAGRIQLIRNEEQAHFHLSAVPISGLPRFEAAIP